MICKSVIYEKRIKLIEKCCTTYLHVKEIVYTFATLSREKRTKEYDILKNIVKKFFSIASKNIFEKTSKIFGGLKILP